MTSSSHWVTMTTNGANQSPITTVSSAPSNSLYNDLRLSVQAVEQAKAAMRTDEYTPEVAQAARQIAGSWAAGIPNQVPVVPSVRRVGSPAWLRD